MTPTTTLFGAVTAQEDRLAIVATGPSLRTFDLTRFDTVPTIAVNGALPHVSAEYWVTIDPSRAQRKIMENPVAGVTYYCGLPADFGPETRLWKMGVRPLAHVHYLERVGGNGIPIYPWLIHSGNSAFAALGLACHMRPSKVALFGVDCTAGPYFYATRKHDRPLRLKHVPALFEGCVGHLAARKVEVVNGSPDSLVTCFPRMSPDEALEWLAA